MSTHLLYNSFLIPAIGMTRGQAIEVLTDISKKRCCVCARYGKCDVLGKGDYCNFVATDDARTVMIYMGSHRG